MVEPADLTICRRDMAVSILQLWHRDDRGLDGAPAPELAGAVNQALGDGPWALRLGPGEWLLCDYDASSIARLSDQLDGTVHHLLDVSGGWAVYHIAGPAAADRIAGGCSLDLDRTVFPPGRCARTLFAGVPAVIHRPDASEAFRLFVDASLAGYFEDWIEATAGGGVASPA